MKHEKKTEKRKKNKCVWYHCSRSKTINDTSETLEYLQEITLHKQTRK